MLQRDEGTWGKKKKKTVPIRSFYAMLSLGAESVWRLGLILLLTKKKKTAQMKHSCSIIRESLLKSVLQKLLRNSTKYGVGPSAWCESQII